MSADKLYTVKSEICLVPMKDGTKLSVYIHRPDAKGRFPAIIGYTPYHEELIKKPDPIVEYGYAIINFDIRGTGSSEGWNDSIYSDQEREDGYNMIEWAAAQPWCNGNVGMWGKSFGAVVSLQMAMAAPPHLKAIIARSGTDDIFSEWTNPGGSPRPYMYNCYSPIMTASNLSPPDPNEVGEQWSNIWKERLEKNIPWGISFLQNMTCNTFWKVRSLKGNYDKIKCAVFLVGGWADWYHNPLLRIFSKLKGPRRILIGPWSHEWPDRSFPGPRIEWVYEAKRWFDFWLKGINNGIMDEPPVTLFIRKYSSPQTILIEDCGQFRSENEWPIARAIKTPFYFKSDGLLSTDPPAVSDVNRKDILDCDPQAGMATGMHGGGPFNINWAMPLDQRLDEAKNLVYTSEPLKEDLEVTGQPVAVLYFSSSAPVTQVIVKLCETTPDGTSVLVTKGFLNVTYRESRSDPSFIMPDQIYKLNIELLTCAYRFQKGNRISLRIAGADFLNLWPTPVKCVNTFYYNSDMPSHICLPVVPPQNPALPSPSIEIGTAPLPHREELTAPGYIIKYDIINDTVTTEFESNYDQNWNCKAKYTVSTFNPAQVTILGESYREFEYNKQKIRTNAICITKSDKKDFHHIVELKITINEKKYFSKSWTVSVPRGFA